MEGKEIKLGAERKTVPTNIGDSINTATNIDASSVNASNITLDIKGTTAANTITGSAQSDTISGGQGLDIINAGGGDDTVIYMNTSQKIDGGTGTDILKIIGNSGIVINPKVGRT